MQDLPAPTSLVALTAEFLRAELLPTMQGAMQFQLRVAINALDLAARQLRGAVQTDAEEHARLVALLPRQDSQLASLDELNRALCGAIATGTLTVQTPGLADHLWATTLAKLAIDQPKYAAYRREISHNDDSVPSPRGRGES